MKNTFFFAPFLFLLFALQGTAQVQVMTYRFEKPQVTTSVDGYSDINYNECMNLGVEGAPLLPWFSASLLLPPGTEISTIRVASVAYYPEETGILVRPAPRQFPISTGAPDGYRPMANPQIYASAAAYPSTAVSGVSTGYLRGHAIGTFNICPVTWFPLLQKVQYIKSITVEISEKTSEKATRALQFLRTDEGTGRHIRAVVKNHDLFHQYPVAEPRDNPQYDMLLITKNDFLPYLEEYISYKQSTGFLIVCKTVETIYSQYPGADNQMKIRNCIIDLYQNGGIDYVLLAGDADPNNTSQNIVPKRGFFADPGSGYDDDDIPSDMYYACLDGTWNNDNDSRWGEPGEDDLFYEVGIGRLCADSPAEIGNMINKLTLYQSSPVVSDIRKGLMIGEQLDGQTYGDDYKDEVVSGGSMNGYTTAGFPLTIDITRLYESLGNWSKTDVFSNFNNGTHLLNHLGHSNTDYNMKMYNSDITQSNFQNDGVTHGYVIGYSQGCYNGSFDNRGTGGGYSTSDCFAEAITTLATAEVAGVSNSRYGWYSPGGTNGGSQFFDRQFFDALFGEDIYCIGDMNSDSKEDNASYIESDQVVRWCAYETNLFGDPTMDIWTEIPGEIAATYPASVSVGFDQIVFETDAPFARIALMQGDSLIGRGLADASGDGTILLNNPLTNVIPITVSIIAHNRIRHMGNILVISDQPYVVYHSSQVNDPLGNNNQLLDPGETIGLTMTLENLGNQDAIDVVAVLRNSDTHITLTDSTGNFGNIVAGGTVSVENAFGLVVSNSIPDQQLLRFDLMVTGDSVWNSHFNLTANAPVLTIGSLSVDDTQSGNGNGRLDAGETVDVIISAGNAGHSAAPNALASLSSGSPYVTIHSGSYNMDTLMVNETTTAVFNLSVAEGTPVGTAAEINFTVTSGGYAVEKTFIAKVSLVLEDFESGNFSHFDWVHGGNQPWTVTSIDPYEGVYSAKSGAIINAQKSQLSLVMDVSNSDSVSFNLKTSAEAIFDFLRFYIDANLMGQWDGETPWTRVAFPVSEGTHTFKWEYKKDGSVSAGSDCAWLDYIVFPGEASEGLSVSGMVTYANASNSPLSDLQIHLKDGTGGIVGTTITGTTGNYAFTNVPAGAYTLDVSTTKPWSGVSALDVLMYRKHIANIALLSGLYLSSGDVNISGDLSAADVLLIKKRIASISSSFPSGDWLFNTVPFVLGSGNLTHDFQGIVYGDANGSYIPAVKEAAHSPQGRGALVIGEGNALDGLVSVPVYIFDVQDLGAFQFTVQYDPGTLRFENITDLYPGMEDMITGTTVPGYLTFVWAAGDHGLSINNGILFNMQFTMLQQDKSDIVWSSTVTPREFCDFNGNLFEPDYTNGLVNGPVGMDETGSIPGLVLYPNPNHGRFMLRCDGNLKNPVTIQVVNSTGRCVYKVPNVIVNGAFPVQLDDQPQGVYMMTISDGISTVNRTFVIR